MAAVWRVCGGGEGGSEVQRAWRQGGWGQDRGCEMRFCRWLAGQGRERAHPVDERVVRPAVAAADEAVLRLLLLLAGDDDLERLVVKDELDARRLDAQEDAEQAGERRERRRALVPREPRDREQAERHVERRRRHDGGARLAHGRLGRLLRAKVEELFCMAGGEGGWMRWRPAAAICNCRDDSSTCHIPHNPARTCRGLPPTCAAIRLKLTAAGRTATAREVRGRGETADLLLLAPLTAHCGGALGWCVAAE